MKPRFISQALGSVHELPGTPPEGEHVLWQGAPGWWALAKSLRIRLVALYMAALLGWYVFDTLWRGAPAPLLHIARMSAVAAAAVLLFGVYAFLVCWTTSYTLTNRRVILQTGIALPISFNIPFSQIASAGLKLNQDGSGDIALSLEPGNKIGFLAIWPHARPWGLSHVQPMLRSVPHAASIAKRLAHLVESDGGATMRVHAASPQAEAGYGHLPDDHMVAAE